MGARTLTVTANQELEYRVSIALRTLTARIGCSNRRERDGGNRQPHPRCSIASSKSPGHKPTSHILPQMTASRAARRLCGCLQNSFKPQGNPLNPFSASYASQLPEQVLERRLRIAAFVLIDILPLADLGFGKVYKSRPIDDGERQKGEADQCVGGYDADPPTAPPRGRPARDGEPDSLIDKRNRHQNDGKNRQGERDRYARIQMRHEHSSAALMAPHDGRETDRTG